MASLSLLSWLSTGDALFWWWCEGGDVVVVGTAPDVGADGYADPLGPVGVVVGGYCPAAGGVAKSAPDGAMGMVAERWWCC